MDAPEDRELWVQRNASELLAELLSCLPKFLFQGGRTGQARQPRRALSGAALSHVLQLLEMFQEWPQLLDPKLEALIKPLNDAFLQSLWHAQGQCASLHQKHEKKYCFPQALCKILYGFCKVRGSKVIVRFLINEARYLEPILDAFETWSSLDSSAAPMLWEERYILLLWLSHLLLTPFDLHTIGSGAEQGKFEVNRIEDLVLPKDLPLISQRLLVVAIRNLSSASKERESATQVLVRLSLRPDMQRLGLQELLIRWAIAQLRTLQKNQKESGYLFIGLLTFLAALMKSADAVKIAPFLLMTFNSVEQFGVLRSGSSSALTRKAAIKMYSACCLAAMSLESLPDERLHFSGQILEGAVDELLSALGDNDTPVRQAASKALSVIAMKLDPEMAADISEAVISSLEENVLWESTVPIQGNPMIHASKQRNLSLVNSSKWQGLILTLSQLLFRRCPPVKQLPNVLNSLILALSFEQRSATGISIGTNVRDAACFGIWATARRYSTEELLATNTRHIAAARERKGVTSVVQLLAIELLASATLDPAGNIRRGSSAALQELIGRHPDQIAAGIPLVQAVDYHAVALRSRAMKEVAITASKLDHQYWTAILQELTTWRGIGATNVDSRRLAAEALGILARFPPPQACQQVITSLQQSMTMLDAGTIQKRQGYILSIASIVKSTCTRSDEGREEIEKLLGPFWNLFSPEPFATDDEMITHTSRPELMNEAMAVLILELALATYEGLLMPPSKEILIKCFRYVGFALERKEAHVIESAVQAVKALLNIADSEQQKNWLELAMGKTAPQQLLSGSLQVGYLLALSTVCTSDVFQKSAKDRIIQQIIAATKASSDIDTRVVALQGLSSIISGAGDARELDPGIMTTIQTSLQDYTVDQRGDVGSLLRIEAIQIVRAAHTIGSLQLSPDGVSLIQFVCTLAGEKLDKVRFRAWSCLTTCLDLEHQTASRINDFPSYAPIGSRSRGESDETADPGLVSSKGYFHHYLNLFKFEQLRSHVLKGLVNSIGGATESILVAARSALSEWLHSQDRWVLEQFGMHLETLLDSSLSDERVLVPALETLAFVLDTNIFAEKNSGLPRWRRLFLLVQKAHYKSSNMAKLLAAVDAYGALAMNESVRQDVIKKLTSLLIHPFPRVRNSAADALFMLTQEGSLKPTDWAEPTKFTKQALLIVKDALDVT